MKNVSNQMFYIFNYYKLGYFIDIIYDNYFFTDIHFALDVTISSPLS